MDRLMQVARYAWKQSKDLSRETGKSRISLFYDMLRCYRKYLMWTNQYMKEKFYSKSPEEREMIGQKYYETGQIRDVWQKDFRENREFFIKYSDIKYEKASLREERRKAYTERYHTGKKLAVEYDVHLSRQHYLDGKITIGDNVLLSKHVFIDYSGEVVLSNDVKLSAGVIIESHRHVFVPGDHKYEAVPTSIIIENGVWVGQNSVICEDTKFIGRYAQIGAGSVVRNPIPPYAIVIGNPAKIVGFIFNPNEVKEFESEHFPNDPTDIAKFEADYNKLFINRIKDIKQLLKN